MKMTLEQIKADIESGKSQRIYYSAQTLWFTHLDDDVIEARKMGRESADRKAQQMFDDPRVPQERKDRLRELRKITKDSITPLDPSGSPLYQLDGKENLLKFISETEKAATTDHYGKHGIEAFLKTHHQNCDGTCWTKWEDVNQAVDIDYFNTFNSMIQIEYIDESDSYGHFPYQMMAVMKDGTVNLSSMVLGGGVENYYRVIKNQYEIGVRNLYVSMDFPAKADMNDDFVVIFSIVDDMVGAIAISYNSETGENLGTINTDTSEHLKMICEQFKNFVLG